MRVSTSSYGGDLGLVRRVRSGVRSVELVPSSYLSIGERQVLWGVCAPPSHSPPNTARCQTLRGLPRVLRTAHRMQNTVAKPVSNRQALLGEHSSASVSPSLTRHSLLPQDAAKLLTMRR